MKIKESKIEGGREIKSFISLSNNELTALEIVKIIWENKIIISLVTLAFIACSIMFSLSLANTYKATAILSPTQSSSSGNGLGGLASQLGGVASLAGLSLGGETQNKSTLALEVLKTRAFIESFIIKYDALVPLMGVTEWDREKGVLLVDPELYNAQTEKWVRKAKYPLKSKPSNWEAYEEFKKYFHLTQDSKTQIITISIEHYSPEVARTWLNQIIIEINNYMRIKDQEKAQHSINFLTAKLENTQLSGMQNVFYQLIEEQTKILMLTEVNDDYVLTIIDPPAVPDIKHGPKRALFVIVGALFGALISVLFVLLRKFIINK